jgi:hypothetical protein
VTRILEKLTDRQSITVPERKFVTEIGALYTTYGEYLDKMLGGKPLHRRRALWRLRQRLRYARMCFVGGVVASTLELVYYLGYELFVGGVLDTILIFLLVAGICYVAQEETLEFIDVLAKEIE